MHITFAIGGPVIVLLLIWLILRGSSDNTMETSKTILSNDSCELNIKRIKKVVGLVVIFVNLRRLLSLCGGADFRC